MQATQVDNLRAAWELRRSRTYVEFVQDDSGVIHRWDGLVPLEEARSEHPELAHLWDAVREEGQRRYLAETPGARQHAEFFELPNVLMPSTLDR